MAKGGGLNKLWYTVFAVLLFLILFAGTIATLFTDFLWFKSLGYENVFTLEIFSKLALLGSGVIIFFVIGFVNLYVAKRLHKGSKETFMVLLSVLSFFALIAGFLLSDGWLEILKYLNYEEFGMLDPIFGMDVSFYIFVLPFLNIIWAFLFGSLIISSSLVAIYYLKDYLSNVINQETDPHTGVKNVTFSSKKPRVDRYMLNHMGILASILFLLIAFRHFISRYVVLYSPGGLVTGAGYTDVNILIPLLTIMIVIAVVASLILFVYIFFISGKSRVKKRHILLYVVAVYLVFLLLGQGLIPQAYQSLVVNPNELSMEKPYLEHNINFTRFAYGLDRVDQIEYEPGELTQDSVERSRETIDNIRILDYRPVTDTFKQTQEIRLYYDLSSLDIDRYNISGEYTQVVLSPRELDQDQLSQSAKTWINQRLVFTHGYGTVMSPVNTVDSEGLPDYIVSDVPPSYATDDDSLVIDNPRIYYGQKTGNYVLANTDTPEFDYPFSGENVFHNYEGSGGVQLESLFTRILMALRFADANILLTSELNEESRIMFNRNVQDRINRVAPFLELDDDPYQVIADGKLYWIQDAYTTSSIFPYSEHTERINYIRNSAKIVVDAYEGSLDFYMSDPEDPIISTYSNIFPDLFNSMDDMPESLRNHVRYPETLFTIQSRKMRTYNMQDPGNFYNKEDAWERPREIYGAGRESVVEPYYMILNLPKIGDGQEFVMMSPFTPERRNNMISWLAGRSDGDSYGDLVLYTLPKDSLYYGPLQVEARIDQNPEISEQLTLWSQQGSRVTRGNLLAIPLEDSFLYVEPLYIQAESASIPEMRRVLVSDGRGVAMGKDLDDALQRLLVQEDIGILPDVVDELPEEVVGEMNGTLRNEEFKEASEEYDRILDSMDSGNWTGFGDAFTRLGEILRDD